MQIDQNTLARLLSLDDDKLGDVIRRIAAESGIDPLALGLDPNSIGQIRAALGSATNEDIARLNTVYEDYRRNRRK